MFAVARLVIGWFPMDRPGAPRTATGTAHGLIAIVTFSTVTGATLRLGAIAGRFPFWHSLALPSVIFGWVMVVSILGMLARRLNPRAGRFFGGFERVLYVAIIGWFAVLAATLLAAA